MKSLKQLSLRNFRLFGEKEQLLKFNSGKNVTVLVGNNGCGKSSILDAIAISISTFTSNFPGQSIKQFKESDVHITEDEDYGDYLQVESVFETSYNGDIDILRYRQGKSKAPEGVLKNVNSYAELLMAKINKEEHCVLPVVAYYGTGRGQIKAPERKRDFKKAFTRWDAYTGALDASANFRQFIEWFDLMEDEERREKESRRDWDYKSKPLESVRKALTTFVGDKFSNPRMMIHPLRFVMDESIGEGKIRQLRIEQLSDGYKIVTAMVADIASRMAEANPDMDDPLQANGIVLIDEVDLHLHPKWQRTIIGSLTKTFPNIQFIVSTHSPIILSGATNDAQVIMLREDSIIDTDAKEYETYDISQLLLSELFGLKSSRSPQWDSLLSEQSDLLKKNERSLEENARLKVLDKLLSQLSFGDSIEQIKSRELLYRIANRLNLE